MNSSTSREKNASLSTRHGSRARWLLIIFILLLVLHIIDSSRFLLQRTISENARQERNPQLNVATRVEIAIVSVFHNEAPFLLEWIAHHVDLGVERFYLYNHESTDDFAQVLAPLISSGLVVLTNASTILGGKKADIEWVLQHKLLAQFASLHHWYYVWRESTEWVLLIDVDEFVWPVDGEFKNGLRSLARSRSFRGVGGIALGRIPFSTDGRKWRVRRDELQTLTFGERKREEMLSREQPKIMYRSAAMLKPFSHLHSFRGAHGPLANAQGVFNGTFDMPCDNCTVPRVESPLVILHYLAGSLESCREKRARSRDFHGGWRHKTHPKYCERLHRGSGVFDEGSFKRDHQLIQKMRARQRPLCSRMQSLNENYCAQWQCCGAYQKLNKQ